MESSALHPPVCRQGRLCAICKRTLPCSERDPLLLIGTPAKPRAPGTKSPFWPEPLLQCVLVPVPPPLGWGWVEKHVKDTQPSVVRPCRPRRHRRIVASCVQVRRQGGKPFCPGTPCSTPKGGKDGAVSMKTGLRWAWTRMNTACWESCIWNIATREPLVTAVCMPPSRLSGPPAPPQPQEPGLSGVFFPFLCSSTHHRCTKAPLSSRHSEFKPHQ